MNKQTSMSFDNPDLSQEQRRLLQAWLKILTRKAKLKPVHLKPGFLNWCLVQSKKELTPANYAYFSPIARKAYLKSLQAYEQHIKAVRSQNGL